MSSLDSTRADRLAAIERRILEGSAQPADSAVELSELALRSHQSIAAGTFGREPTELRVRLHGKGVRGHLVPADQAGALIGQTQMLVRWIGARLRTLGDETQMPARQGERLGVAEATRLFLRPQFGAGSLIFNMVGSENEQNETGSASADPDEAMVTREEVTDSLLDRALRELLAIVESSQADSPDAPGDLSGYVSRMGPRVASQLHGLAEQVTKNEIDLDLRWSGTGGRRRSANLDRRGALAIRDAVARNKVRTDEIVLTGTLETASTGRDQVRIDTPSASFKMDVDGELGVTLGQLLGREVTARVERRRVWRDSGQETQTYKLMGISVEPQLDDDAATQTTAIGEGWFDDGTEQAVEPSPDLPESQPEEGVDPWRSI